MPNVKARTWIALASASALGLALVGWATYAGLLWVCEQGDYTILVTRLDANETPARFVNLTSEDLVEYPLISDVLATYGNPAIYPGARFEGEFLVYPIVTRPSDTRVTETMRFLAERFGGRPYPVVITTGDGVCYTWELLVSDPGPFGPCT